MVDSIRVLIVEDCKDTAETTAMMLDVWGMTATIARDGATALGAMYESVPDILLLDIGLKGMSGFEVADAIRSSPRFDRTMIVVMSGYADAAHRDHSRLSGCQHHFVKPVDLNILHQILLDGLKEFRNDVSAHACAVGDRSGCGC